MKYFRLQVLIRIIIITLLLGLICYFFFVEDRWLRSAYLLFFTLIAIGEFYWYIDRTNREISTFLTSLMQNDFTTSFSTKGRGRSFRQLHETFNLVTDKFKEISAEREARHLYLEALVAQVKVGIISYDQQEKVHLINQAFRELTGKQSLGHLSGLDSVDSQLLAAMRTLRPGQSRLISATIDGRMLQLNLHVTEFLLPGISYKLVSIQNIRQALDVREVEAWQKLMRVLTHEIMNSVSPITSLSETLISLMKNRNESLDQSENVTRGLEAIQARSSGLESFTRAYRQLTAIPAPRIREVVLKELLERIHILMYQDLKTLTWEVDCREDVLIKADPDLLGQVFINLIRNSLDALAQTEQPEINIRATLLVNGTEILFSDNGSGIPEDKISQIFVPFFTTKKSGSGIGLAVCQQVIQLHGGNIDVQSRSGRTTFRILLPG